MTSRSHVTHFLWAVTHFVVVRYDERQGHYLWKDEIPWVSLQCSGLGQPRALVGYSSGLRLGEISFSPFKLASFELRGACPVTRLNTREKAAALW